MRVMNATGEQPDMALPAPVQDVITEHTAEVVRVATADGGYTPGVKYLAKTGNGVFYFCGFGAGSTGGWTSDSLDFRLGVHRPLILMGGPAPTEDLEALQRALAITSP